jgi:acetyl-CoA hydrolase
MDTAGDLLKRHVRSGSAIVVGQCAGEPETLVQALVDVRESLTGSSVYRGMSLTDIIRPEHSDHLRIVSSGALGTNRRLAEAGVLDLLPLSVSEIPKRWRAGHARADVVLLQVCAHPRKGMACLGVTCDYLPAAISAATVVIAEVNSSMPSTCGDTLIPWDRITARIETETPLRTFPTAEPRAEDLAIGAQIAELVSDRATVQIGVGRSGDAVLACLSGHRELGIHTGLLNDAFASLIRSGVATGAYKTLDPGLAVTPVVAGTRSTYAFVEDNPAISMRSVEYTNDPRVTSQLQGFTAINFALEVDLTGQVNSEQIGRRYVGAVGGAPDFVRAALAAPAGRSIIGLASMARGRSRIVPKIESSVVTTPRCDADVVVTEWGKAELRDASLRQRALRLAAISHPTVRDKLTAFAKAM